MVFETTSLAMPSSTSLTESSCLSLTSDSITYAISDEDYLSATISSSTISTALSSTTSPPVRYNVIVSESYLESLSDEELAYFSELLAAKEQELTNVPKPIQKLKSSSKVSV